MRDRAKRTVPITPRTLKFNLEDFLEAKEEAGVILHKAGQANGGSGGGEKEARPILNLFTPLEMPFNAATPSSP